MTAASQLSSQPPHGDGLYGGFMRSCQRGGMQMIHLRHLSRALVLLAVAALLAAGCGGSAPSGNRPTGQPSDDQQLKLVQCLRQHGVNASIQNGRVNIPNMTDQQTSSSRGSQAMQACANYLPNGGQADGKLSPQQLDAMTKFAQCMRDHGIPMSDPNPAGGAAGPEISRSGTDPSKLQQAQQACQHYVPGNMRLSKP